MKVPSSYLFALAFAISLLGSTAVRAEEIALNFELQPQQPADRPEPNQVAADAVAEVPVQGPKPLRIPAGAGSPPMRSHSPSQLPGGVYRKAVAVGLQAGNSPAALLPPAPPWYAPPAAVAQQPSPPEPEESDPQQEEPRSPLVALAFDAFSSDDVQVAQAKAAPPPKPPANPLDALFEGGNDSLVARAVGSAEGTRTPTGGFNSAYKGHTDPGNGVWNMGTFSYQHGARTPAEADQKQLRRLQSQTQVLKRRAIKHNLNLNLEETLNGIDLANQSPLASIGRVGYIERLVEARNMGYTGFESIVVARTRSYINPDTQRWNAPGLGNTLESITRDQRRRASAVAKAMEVYQQENPHIAWEHWAMMPSADSTLVAQSPTPEEKPPAKVDDLPLTFGPDQQPAADAKAVAQATAAEPSQPEAEEVVPPPSEDLGQRATNGISQLLAAVRPEKSSPGNSQAESEPGPETAAPPQEEQTKEPPSWMATLERNQTVEALSDFEQVASSEPTSRQPDAAAGTMPETPSIPQEESPIAATPPQGATPETNVMPPLRDDEAPVALPGLGNGEEVFTTAPEEPQIVESTPLPEGLLGQLKTQVKTVKEDSAAGLSTMRDQLVEQIFEIDLSKPADPE